MFIDHVTIKVKAGNGGNGCVSFRREKFVPKGGPDGGDGGDGGAVILRATRNEQSLVALRYMPHYEGKSGESGKGKGRHGHKGDDRVVYVPVGTVVYDPDTREVLADMTEDGQEFIAAKPGKGGAGNIHFKTSTNQAPRKSKPGTEGEEKTLFLELKTVADVGLVGFPNAGKSTLITAVSDAHPKTAPYPFTTLHPNVGVIEFEDFYRFTMADIPGLINGAHNNVGLGHDFLRHIERCRVFIYVLDAAGVDDRDPVSDMKALVNELELYREGLSQKPAVIAANKIDLLESEDVIDDIRKAFPNFTLFPICATEKRNAVELVMHLRSMLEGLS
jgi:GTP-binding protein